MKRHWPGEADDVSDDSEDERATQRARVEPAARARGPSLASPGLYRAVDAYRFGAPPPQVSSGLLPEIYDKMMGETHGEDNRFGRYVIYGTTPKEVAIARIIDETLKHVQLGYSVMLNDFGINMWATHESIRWSPFYMPISTVSGLAEFREILAGDTLKVIIEPRVTEQYVAFGSTRYIDAERQLFGILSEVYERGIRTKVGYRASIFCRDLSDGIPSFEEWAILR